MRYVWSVKEVWSIMADGAYKILIPMRTPRITLIRRVIFRSFRIEMGRNVKIRSWMQFIAILVSKRNS